MQLIGRLMVAELIILVLSLLLLLFLGHTAHQCRSQVCDIRAQRLLPGVAYIVSQLFRRGCGHEGFQVVLGDHILKLGLFHVIARAHSVPIAQVLTQGGFLEGVARVRVPQAEVLLVHMWV